MNKTQQHVDGFVRERPNSIANALELRLSCTNPSILQNDDMTTTTQGTTPQCVYMCSLWDILDILDITYERSCWQRFQPVPSKCNIQCCDGPEWEWYWHCSLIPFRLGSFRHVYKDIFGVEYANILFKHHHGNTHLLIYDTSIWFYSCVNAQRIIFDRNNTSRLYKSDLKTKRSKHKPGTVIVTWQYI